MATNPKTPAPAKTPEGSAATKKHAPEKQPADSVAPEVAPAKPGGQPAKAASKATAAGGAAAKGKTPQSPPAGPPAPRVGPNVRRRVSLLVTYYFALLLFLFMGAFDVLVGNLRLLQWFGVNAQELSSPTVRTLGFTLIGGFIGSILYHVRVLFYYYTKDRFDPRWTGKYLTAPWEGAALAMVVLALLRGGLAVLGGSSAEAAGGNAADSFAAFGTGALVGFGMRDVVGWLGALVKRSFSADRNSG